MATKSKADLATRVKRLEGALKRAKAKNTALGESLAEAHERERATAEILRVINRSPGDAQPVFDAIAAAALRLIGGASASVVRVAGEMLHLAAFTSTNKDGDETLRTSYPRPVAAEGGHNQALRLRAPHYVSDADRLPKRQSVFREVARARGFRSAVFVPLLRGRVAVGSIGVTRRDPGAFSDHQIGLLKTFADQAVIAIENARLFNEAKESLEQQTAISEILRVMSTSPTDVSPVLDTVAERAARICEANDVRIFLVDGDALRYSAGIGSLGALELGETRPIDRGFITGRAVLDRMPLQVDDLAASAAREQFPLGAELQERFGHRTIFAMPLVREDRALGVILLRRLEVRPFSDKQVALLKTFADQAAIAIENVRLFEELQTRNAELSEALEQQTATAKILQVISSSPTDLQPVFDTILDNARRLCEAHRGALHLYDGDAFTLVADQGATAAFAEYRERERVNRAGALSAIGQLGERKCVVHIPDLAEWPGYASRDPMTVASVELEGTRTYLGIPMLRDGKLLGAITFRRQQVRPFSDKQIALLQVFAAQAVIAIENVRLFKELQARNAELTEALEQQTATAEILRAIAGSPTDIQPVLDVVAESAARLCEASDVVIRRVEGDVMRVVSHIGPVPIVEAAIAPTISPGSVSGRAILERRTIHVADVLAPEVNDEYAEALHHLFEEKAFRTVLIVPLVREDVAIGSIIIRRPDVRPFSDKQIRLLQTFADQAVIAIENVRLFNETKEALEQQTATSEILKVISGSPNDLQPVFQIILENAVRMCSAGFGTIFRFDGNVLHRVSSVGTPTALIEFQDRRGPFVPEPGSKFSEILRTKSICHMVDAAEEDRQSVAARYGGARSVLHVPLLKDDQLVGAIVIYRKEVRPFTDKQIDLVRSFASQAVIAIENVRLFKELEARNSELSESLERQTATSEILRVISSSLTDTQPVFDAIVRSGARLFEGANVSLRLVKGNQVEHVASSHDRDRTVFALDDNRQPSTRAIRGKEAVIVNDMLTEDWITEEARERATRRRFRGLIAAPLMRAGEAIGTLAVNRAAPGPFTQQQIDLLKTFADQAVIAIENVRLFNETKEALERQTVISEILRVISSSPTDTQPVFDAIVKAGVPLFGGMEITLRLVKGDLSELVASTQRIYLIGGPNPTPLDDESHPGARAIKRRDVVQVADMRAAEGWVSTAFRKRAEVRGFRAIMGAPLIRNNAAIGAITVTRAAPGLFGDKQVALLKTFADQAVIAIENVRLFKELEARNAEITEALEQQTATAEILRVISSSPTDLQPVFDTILESATRLCGAHLGTLGLYDEKKFVYLAQRGGKPEFVQRLFGHGPFVPIEGTNLWRMITGKSPVHVQDLPNNDQVRSPVRLFVDVGAKTILAVPMLKEGRVVGGIIIFRPEVRPFSQEQIDLVSTFANQAVIAIENVRLFKELQAQTNALSRSVNQLTALGDVGQAISSTLDLETVLSTIVSRALQLTGLDSGSIYEYDPHAQVFRLQATENMPEEIIELVRKSPIRIGDGAVGLTGVTHEVAQVADILDPSYQSGRRDLLVRSGYRALLAVPLLRDEQLLGVLLVHRKSPGAFAPEVVDLLKTFATQSALAIQNARLFREIAEKGRQLEVASQHKSQFLASMSHELRTPLNAMLGFNEMILGEIYGPVPPDLRDPLTDIQSSGKHLLRLINNVLDLAKIEAGRMELSLADYSVHDTVESVRSTLHPLAADKGLELTVSVPENIPFAYGDSGRITQCLMNLAGNSLKFTKQGSVRIAVDLNGEALIYRVTDTGIGIAPDNIESLFTEFKQTDATIASEFGGTGLGLSITKKFVEMHGGRIWVESELGKGSQFIFEIPLRTREGASA